MKIQNYTKAIKSNLNSCLEEKKAEVLGHFPYINYEHVAAHVGSIANLGLLLPCEKLLPLSALGLYITAVFIHLQDG